LEIAKDCFENGFQMKDSKQIDNGLKIVNLTNNNKDQKRNTIQSIVLTSLH